MGEVEAPRKGHVWGASVAPGRRGVALRYGAFALVALGIFVATALVGQRVHGPDDASVRATTIGRCDALHVSDVTKHAKDDFRSIVPGRATAVHRADDSWTVVSPLELSGHVLNGVPDDDRVTVTKTCTFSRDASRSRTEMPESLSVQFDGTRAQFVQNFALDPAGVYAYTGGSGLKGP